MKGIPEGVFGGDDRAVAPVLGVILLFGIAAIGLSVWQTTVIPDQNADTEFKHYLEVQGDMGDLRQAHLETVASGEPKAPTLKLGVAYKTRIIGVNPPNPSGTIRDEDVGNFGLEGAPDSTSDSMITTADVCGVDQPSTDRLRYDPSYNRLSDRDAPPVMYENTVLYRETADGEYLFESDQLLIQGSTINILPIQTDLDRTGRSTSIDLSSEGYLVEKNLEAGAAPTVIVPTKIPASTWENELLDSQIGTGPDDGSVREVKGPSAPGIDPGEVGIVLNEKGDPFPWTVRCAITTDGRTTDFTEPVKPPQVLNGGVGQGGTTEHTAETNSDEMVLVNGKWLKIDDISEILVGPSDTTQVPNRGGFSGGQGAGLKFKLEDGESDETVYVQAEVTGEPGNWQAKTVKMTTNPANGYQSKSLTSDAAKKLLETGRVDILDVDNYQGSSFETQDGSFGSYVDTIEAMENATYRTSELHGRVDVQIVSGNLGLTIADDDRTQTYIYNSTSARQIDFEVTADGTTDGPENVDLKVRDSQGQQLDSTSPRVDRQTIDLDAGSETFTLTWFPDYDSLSSGTEYEILVEGESDQALGKVQLLQQDSAYVEVELIEYNETVEYGDDLTGKARVTNLGDADKTDTIKLQVEGNCCPSGGEASESVDVPSGESKTVTLSYDTGALDTDSIGEVEVSANSSNSGDVATANITGPSVIQKPFVEDIRAGQERLNHRMGFTLGEDAGQSTIKIDLGDTADAVSYDLNKANWTVVNGSGSINDVNTGDNGGTYVTYQTNSDDRAGDRIVLEADYTDTSSADTSSITRYDVTYELTSAGNGLPQGETNSTSFKTTRGEDIDVEIEDPGTPVEYGEDLTARLLVKNNGAATGSSNVQLSLAGTSGPDETVEDLTPGESKTINMTYDTGDLDRNDIGDVELEAETSDDTDSQTVTIESPVIQEPFVDDIRAGRERLNHSMGFRLGEDIDQATVEIDLADTGDAVRHDGDSDGNWTVVEGNGSISGVNTNDNRVMSVEYQTNATHDRVGDRIVIEADYTNTTGADVDSSTEYDVTYELRGSDNYPSGETDLTSFETTPGEDIEVKNIDTESSVEYGENLTATVRVENEGGESGSSEVQLSLAGTSGPRETVQLEPGETMDVPLRYDTGELSSNEIGTAELEAETRDDTDSRTVTIEPPTLIEEPFVENVSAGEEQLNQSMGFTLGEDTDQAEIKIDLTNTSDAVSYDNNADSNWTVVKGNGSISLNTNNNRVTSVKYTTHSTDDRAGDEIVIAADYTDTTGAESGQVYDILYEVTPNTDNYNNDETNSTSFETT